MIDRAIEGESRRFMQGNEYRHFEEDRNPRKDPLKGRTTFRDEIDKMMQLLADGREHSREEVRQVTGMKASQLDNLVCNAGALYRIVEHVVDRMTWYLWLDKYEEWPDDRQDDRQDDRHRTFRRALRVTDGD